MIPIIIIIIMVEKQEELSDFFSDRINNKL